MKKLILLSICLTLVFDLALIVPAWAVCPEQAKLTALDSAAKKHFGLAVSISGDYAIVGAPTDDYYTRRPGCAYIFEREGTTWSQQAKLTSSDGHDWDFFGYSAAICGDYAIVGANEFYRVGIGSAYIFKRVGGSWIEQVKLTASDGRSWRYFGQSVSICGDYCLVGAPGAGSAYIFERDGENWVEQAKLSRTDRFGCSVSINGDYCIVGAYLDDDKGRNSGSAYIFKRDGESWTLQAKLTASDGAARDYFGHSVSISGDYCIVGADEDDGNETDSGSAYIFKRIGENWIEQTKLTASDAEPWDFFGRSVSISGDYCVVGAYEDNENGTDSGSSYIFKRDGADWREYAKLAASDGQVGDHFGGAVSINGDYVIAGAYEDDDYGDNSGSAYIFTYEPGTLQDLEITGPNEVPPNFSTMYQAIAHYDNCCTEDVTDLANWWLAPKAIGSIEAGLLLTKNVHKPRDITIYAEYTEDDVTVEAEMSVHVSVPQTLYVPADYTTIQDAIDAAHAGDTIIVDPGTYTGEGNRDIDFLGKAITVRSTDPNDPNIVAATIIDCNGTEAERHRGFKFHSVEGPNSVASGFTIINGWAPEEDIGFATQVPVGGGIFCISSSPTVTCCRITDCIGTGAIWCEDSKAAISNCTISDNWTNWGGGIGLYESNATIADCTISSNWAQYRFVGILCYRGNPTITGCSITNSKVGIQYWYADPIITSCTISDNDGSGVDIYDGEGAITDCNISGNASFGIYCGSGNPIISNCTVSDNSAGGIVCAGGNPAITNCTISNNGSDDYHTSGGILWCGGPITDCIITNNSSGYSYGGGGLRECGGPITNCIISGNSASGAGGGLFACDGPITNCIITGNSAGYGGGLSDCSEITNCIISRNSAYIGGGLATGFYRSTELVSNCIISGNSAVYGGGLSDCRRISNCTIIGNRAERGGGLYSSHLYLSTNNIIWNNFAPRDPQLLGGGLSYSCIQDWPGWGTGNINTDPCFVEAGYWADACDPNIIVEPNDPNAVWVEGDYHLLGNSPCVDTGDPNFVPEPNETDLDGNPRVVDGDNDGNSVVDMGAFERMPEPAELIAWLLEEVAELELPGGIENSLMAKLNAALGALEDENENNDAAAINTLEAFINAVEAQRGKKIPVAEADALIAAALEIIDLLSDG